MHGLALVHMTVECMKAPAVTEAVRAAVLLLQHIPLLWTHHTSVYFVASTIDVADRRIALPEALDVAVYSTHHASAAAVLDTVLVECVAAVSDTGGSEAGRLGSDSLATHQSADHASQARYTRI